MFLPGEPSEEVTGFPGVDEYLGILRFVANLPREAAVILVCVSEDDASDIRDANSVLAQFTPQCVRRDRSLRTYIDQRQRIFLDQVDIDVANIKRRGNREGDNFHCGFRIADCGFAFMITVLGWLL